MRRRLCLLVALILLVGCVDSAQQASLLAAQQAKADSATARPRLYYIGLGLFSESWSANDVVELGDELRQTADFAVVPLIAANFRDDPPRYPLADETTIANLVKTVAGRARPDDVVMVHFSTHGSHGALASKIDDRQVTAVSGYTLANLLAPLAAHRTVIIISACYSGSLIDSLRAENRIIITAARADRSSFGCEAGAKHTFFGEAELYGFGQQHRSLHQAFLAIRDDVARMERERHYRPSEPQVFVGAKMVDLYEAPVF